MRNKVKEFQTLLEFDEKRHLVGVKFIHSKEKYDSLAIKEATHQMFFCMMVKAATVGHELKCTKEQLYCSAARNVLGFDKPDEDLLSGKTFHSRNMYGDEKAASDIAKDIPYLDHNVYGLIVKPLELYEDEPDVVISFCKPYTAMRIMQSYSYKYGFAKNIRLAGMGGVCTELMARSYKNRDINISFLCSGTRFSAEWKDDEMGISFSYDMFENILDGVRSTLNTFEPDNKKEDIINRASKNGCEVDVEIGTNYYESCLGVAKKGVKGYHPKKNKGKVYEEQL